MDAQEQNDTFTEHQKVKEETVEQLEYSSESSDGWQIDFELERPYAAKNGPVRIKRRPRGPKYDTKRVRVVSDNPRKSERCKRKRERVDNFSDNFEARTYLVVMRAREVQANLPPEFPSFIKIMLGSHVTKGFWLGLPVKFCKLHLPRHDDTVVLEDESGEEYKTNFLADKVGLSGGWRGFSIAQKLLEGDVVVFHLVKPCKFKVYTVRANDLAVVDGALSLLNFDVHAKETDFGAYAETNKETCEKAEETHSSLVSPDVLRDNVEENRLVVVNSNPGPVSDLSESDRENLSDMEGIGLSRSIADFENFSVVVNDMIIDSELSKPVKTKYYKLCCTQKSCLHDHLLKSNNSTLAAAIISETVNIADAIRACKLSTSRDDFAIWDKTLGAFELLGMDVGFLRARLNRLVSLALESTEVADSKRYKEARDELDHTKEEMRSLELKLLELKQARSRLDDEMEAFEANAHRYQVMFEEEAKGPW